MLKIKECHPARLPQGIDYILEDGTQLATSEWNGEVYTVKENGYEVTYRPVVENDDEDEEVWKIIGFKKQCGTRTQGAAQGGLARVQSNRKRVRGDL